MKKNTIIDQLIQQLEKMKEPEAPRRVRLTHGWVSVTAIIDRSNPDEPRVSIVDGPSCTKLDFSSRKSVTMRGLGQCFIEAADIADAK